MVSSIWFVYSHLWLAMSLLPPACHLSWFSLAHFVVAILLTVRLTEGAWWTYFKWLKALLPLFIFFLAVHPVPQLDVRDARYHMATSFDLVLTGYNTTFARLPRLTRRIRPIPGHLLMVQRARSAALARLERPYIAIHNDVSHSYRRRHPIPSAFWTTST